MLPVPSSLLNILFRAEIGALLDEVLVTELTTLPEMSRF